MEDIIIVGSGCAGLTAAVYTARAELNPLVLSGTAMGGQLAETTSVENYPGFPEGGIEGPQLMQAMQKQAQEFGARVEMKSVKSTSLKPGGPHRLTLNNDNNIDCRALIVATGARARWLGLPSEEALRNKGVSACATCDGALYKNVPVVVIGGGDAAMEDANFLTRFTSQVTVIHRRDKLRASRIMQERAFNNPNISFRWNSVVEEILDVNQGKVTGIRVRNKESGEIDTISCSGVFLAIGHMPNTDPFVEYLDHDEQGYLVLSSPWRSFTNVDGVFAAGDCADKVYRQAVTAAGMGCRAAMDAEQWLAGQEV